VKADENWKRMYQEAYYAISAMRNDLNELFPIESKEATLGLRGPEITHECEAITEAIFKTVIDRKSVCV